MRLVVRRSRSQPGCGSRCAELRRARQVDPDTFPDAVLNGSRLDLFGLYREVVTRGGFTCVPPCCALHALLATMTRQIMPRLQRPSFQDQGLGYLTATYAETDRVGRWLKCVNHEACLPGTHWS